MRIDQGLFARWEPVIGSIPPQASEPLRQDRRRTFGRTAEYLIRSGHRIFHDLHEQVPTGLWEPKTSVPRRDLRCKGTATRAEECGRMPAVIFSLVYLLARRLVQLLVLRGRSDASKDVEDMVLRPQVSVLRRQVTRLRPPAADRAVLAVLAAALPRVRWPVFFVQPKTLLR